MNSVLKMFFCEYTYSFVALYFVLDYGFQNLLIKRDEHENEGKLEYEIHTEKIKMSYYTLIVFGFIHLLDCINLQGHRISHREKELLERMKKFFEWFEDGRYKTMYLSNPKFLQSIDYNKVKIRSLEEIRNCDIKSLLVNLCSQLNKEDFEIVCTYFRDAVTAYESQFEWDSKNLKDAKDFIYQITGV